MVKIRWFVIVSVGLATLSLPLTAPSGLAQSSIPNPAVRPIANRSATASSLPADNSVASPVANATGAQAQQDGTPAHERPKSFASPGMANLKLAIDRAQAALSAATLPDPVASKTQLIQQMESFEAYLGGTQSENARAWQKFLKWRELLAQLGAREPDLKVLTDVQLRYQQNIAGLELPQFQKMREAITHYINAKRFGDNPEGTLRVLNTQLEKLTEMTYADSEASELERMRDISQLATYLHAANQAPELVATMRSIYSQPNLRLQVGENFVNRAVGRPVAQPNPVDECVLGTRVLGQSFISGSVFADLQPQVNGVSLRLTLAGDFSSNNVGYNRGVKVYTTGRSPVYASKLITITPDGTFTQPAVASTNLQTDIHGIDHRLRIVRRIASKKAVEQKPEANAIGQYRLETRLARQFNDQVEQQLAQGGGAAGGLSVLKQERVELVRLAVPRPSWSLASNASHILADVKGADTTQLAASSPSPLPKSANDVVAEVHQSLPINLASSVLGGRTLHSWEMDDLVRQFTPEVPQQLLEESEGDPWSITFAEHQPVEVEFVNGQAVITLRIVRMANEDQELAQPAKVTAIYRPAVGGGYLVMERIGEVEMTFVRAPSGIRSVALRSFFKGKFDKLFRERSDPRSVVFSTRIPNISQLAITNVTFNQGWAQVTLR